MTLPSAPKALNASAMLWLLVAAPGQWAFVVFMIAHYGGSTLRSNLPAWGDATVHGYVAGDAAGNLLFGLHILLAIIITLGGVLQLVPKIRAKAINFHRWNGRAFFITAILLGIGGLYLVWVRGATSTTIRAWSITLNGVMLFAFAALAWRAVRARRIADHRKWALRTFLMVNGVWFFRIGLVDWFMLNRGPVGMEDGFDGWFDKLWGFGSFLFPLAMLELYFFAQEKARPRGKYAVAILIALLTVFMAAGIIGAIVAVWGPHLWGSQAAPIQPI